MRKAWRARLLSASVSCSHAVCCRCPIACISGLFCRLVQLLCQEASVNSAELASIWLLQLLCCLWCAHALADAMHDMLTQLATMAAANLTLLG